MVVSEQQNNDDLASLTGIVGLLYVREQYPAKDCKLGNNGSDGGCTFWITTVLKRHYKHGRIKMFAVARKIATRQTHSPKVVSSNLTPQPFFRTCRRIGLRNE